MTVAFDPLAPGFVESPYEQYAALRSADPVHRSDLLAGWVLTRYDDVDRVLRDPTISVEQKNAAGNPLIDVEIARMERDGRSAATLVLRDEPDHGRLRRLLQPPFGPRAVAGLHDLVHDRVAEVLDRLVPLGRMDVVADFAYPLPVGIFCDLLGVPPEDSPRFRTWTQAVARNLDPVLDPSERDANLALLDEMEAYLTDLVEEKRRIPGEDLMSALVHVEEDGDRLTPGELVPQVLTLYVAGHEPVTALVGNGLLALLRHPDQLARLQADPSLLHHAVLELLRYDGPNQFVRRIATRPMELSGRAIAPGDVLYCSVAAANRDPEHFGPDADQLVVDRPDAGSHLQFGAGVHTCLGTHLARLQAEAMLGQLLAGVEDIELDGDVVWSRRMVLRSVDRLPIRFRATP
ncbi:MAG: cytochrome P450 [Acidimicrobiia bacterium]|jgi:cytochrome P450